MTETTLVNHLAAMEDRLGRKMETTDAKVVANSVEIKELRCRVDKNESELDDRIIRVVCSIPGIGPLPSAGSGLSGPSASGSSAGSSCDGSFGGPAPFTRHRPDASQCDRREAQYNEARRSLRMWPVPGPDLKASLKNFLTNGLKLGGAFMDTVGPISVDCHYDPRSKVADEAIVVFSNKETRDAVRSAATNLASHGKAAGIRMQVPGFLLTNFRALENLGYQMKNVNPSVRRVVKFDNDNMDVMMDVKIGDQWRRVRPADAIRAKKNTPGLLKSGPADMTLDNITDFFAPVPPAASK